MMHIILTHEQADFDAIASLLGAHFLSPGSIPVLPRKLNRNVRAFLTLYGAELPFVDLRDLPSTPIDEITLVDTQSMATIKGVHAKTRVRVIDHHPLREDIPTEWSITLSATGANTTLILELLQGYEIELDAITATLLLLGIYEDTGSLMYASTTARDLQAAAYLVERGANLSIMNDFLNHPLSDEQKAVFELLQKSAETIVVHGYRIVICQTDVGEFEEELSTIAHKLRDVLDPDGLFVLVKTRGGVQMIARSMTDDINVGNITAHFGGGGHVRAAASLIKDGDLQGIQQELKRVLQTHVKPSITVGYLMSRDPQIVAPDTPVGRLAELMQKFGHEGFPVAEGNRLLGLVTRRAVDRAIAHKLNLTAQQIMDVGEVTVHPDDSLESLQLLMTTSGWGQIPVVEPDSGKIIGIVTRTDLIKTLPLGSKTASKINLSSKLEKSLPAAQVALIKLVAACAYQEKYALFIVGGFVRDLLLEATSVDFDLVVEGNAIELAKRLGELYGGGVTSHHRFRTAKWRIDKQNQKLLEELERYSNHHLFVVDDLPDTLDFVTARAEFYTHPTALPTVEPGSIKLDLHRRDFTINTLALRLDGSHYGELYDYWGGLSDLRKGIVRVLHSLSFVDDPTRILRAVRFEQRFRFQIEERTLQLLKEATGLLSRVSGDRIRHELDLILVEEQRLKMLQRLEALGVLRAIYPGLVWNDALQAAAERILSADPRDYKVDYDFDSQGTKRELMYIVLLLNFTPEETGKIIRVFHIPAKMQKLIRDAQSLWKKKEELLHGSRSELVSNLEGVHPLAIYAVTVMFGNEEFQGRIREYTEKWSRIKCYTDGTMLKKLGIPPGPIYRSILTELREAWMAGKVTNQSEERELLGEILQRIKTSSN
jgi:tRNA nucleotidyltransferase (CCA-adding enzyme)